MQIKPNDKNQNYLNQVRSCGCQANLYYLVKVGLAISLFSLLAFFAPKSVLAWWMGQVSFDLVKLTTGDWRPPAAEVSLEQQGQSYLVKEVVDETCQGEHQLAGGRTLSCPVHLDHLTKLPQYIGFEYLIDSTLSAELVKPSLTVKLTDCGSDQTLVLWQDGISTDSASLNTWFKGWLALDNQVDLSQLNSSSTCKLIFQSQTSDSVILKLKNITSLVLAVSVGDKLALKATEPVSWQIKYLRGGQENKAVFQGQEASLLLDSDLSQAEATSWQIQATDLAGNLSQVIQPKIYFLPEGDLNSSLKVWENQKEADNLLVIKLVLDRLGLDQFKNFRLQVESGQNDDTWQKVDLVKITPFILAANTIGSPAHSFETLVLQSSQAVDKEHFCLQAQLLSGRWQQLKCND